MYIYDNNVWKARTIKKLLFFRLIFTLNYIVPVSADTASDTEKLLNWAENIKK